MSKTQDATSSCLQQSRIKSRDTPKMQVEVCKSIFHENGNQKRAQVAVVISHKYM